ncbi:MAG: hypothetical protein WKF61_00115 [Luteimonas sp.]
MKTTQLLSVTIALALLSTAGCNKPSSELSSEQPKAVPVAVQPVGMDKPLAAENIDLSYKILTGPAYNSATDTVTYQIETVNNGKATLVSAGSLPVHLGVVIRGTDGTMNAPPANLEFMRIPFPQPLESGQSVTLPVEFKVSSTIGGTVVLDAVQEQVGWFSGYKKPVLTLGTFQRCNAAENTLCLADGTAVPAVQ